MASIQHRTTGRSVELDADTLIGSSSRCDLTLRHDSVSRNHASICWLDGAWHLVDPTGLARTDRVARICVGRDATDIAFMTIFGQATLNSQRVAVSRAD